MQVFSNVVNENIPKHLWAICLFEFSCDWSNQAVYLVYLFFFEEIGYLSTINQVVNILEKALISNLEISKDESNFLLFAP